MLRGEGKVIFAFTAAVLRGEWRDRTMGRGGVGIFTAMFAEEGRRRSCARSFRGMATLTPL